MLALRRLLALGLTLSWVVALPAADQKKKSKKDPDFVLLDELVDRPVTTATPPSALTVETARLAFLVSAPSNKRLLSQQTEAALKSLFQKSKGGRIVKIRAFVAGTGDLRSVQSTIVEEFQQRRLPLPVLNVIQVGALPHRDSQVILEATLAGRSTENPHGLAFVSGQAAVSDEFTLEVAPLAELSIRKVLGALGGAGLTGEDVLRVSCFASSLDDADAVFRSVAAAFPEAVHSLVQIQRAPSTSVVQCEAVARLRQPPPEPVTHFSLAGAGPLASYTPVVLVNTPQLVLTGGQLAFRYQEEDARLAFERLLRILESNRTSTRDVVMANVYPLSALIAETVRKVRGEFLDEQRPPAGTMLTFQGLPALDAAFALEVVAAPRRP